MVIAIFIACFVGAYFMFKGDWDFVIPMGLILGILATGIIAVIGFSFNDKTEYKESYRTAIVSVDNSQELQGRFFLGSGYVGTSQVYYAMQDLGEDKYKSATLYASDVDHIKETNSVKPCIITYEQETTNKVWKWLFFKSPVHKDYSYVIVVPKNTVIVKYKVN